VIDLKHLPPAVAKMLAQKELERRGVTKESQYEGMDGLYRFMEDHPDEYARICAKLEAEY
jgi:hypothetical protein